MKLLTHRPSRATVVAYLALVVALGGTSYAAVQLPKNRVGPKQLQKNAVTSVDVKNGALDAVDVKPGSIDGGLVKDDSLTGAGISESTLNNVPTATTADQVKAGGVTAPALADASERSPG